MFSKLASDDLRERVVGRSLEAARARSTERYERLVAAARDLANERQSAAFTVQEVARRAGYSLKGFYRCFAGKDELVVALLAEDSVLGSQILGARVEACHDHRERLRACVVGLFELLTLPGATGYARVLVREYRRLWEERPAELRAALAPIVDVVAQVVDDARRDGVVRSPDPVRDALTVFTLVLDGIDDVTLGRAEPLEQAEYLWSFCGRALGVAMVPDPSPRPRTLEEP